MPLGIIDAVRGRAKMGQVTQSFRQDINEQGFAATVVERAQSNVNKVRGRMGGGAMAPGGPSKGPLGKLQDRIRTFRGPFGIIGAGGKKKSEFESEAGGMEQKLGPNKKPQSDYGSVD